MIDENTFSDPELSFILNISGNEICADCNGKKPYWSSVNNGVLLCAKCTRKHRKYGNKISRIKSLEVDKWEKIEILLLKLGGNSRFNNLMSEYNIPLTKENQEYKYHTKIAEYYRKMLEEETKGKSINLEKPSLKDGIQKIDSDNDNNESINNNDIENINSMQNDFNINNYNYNNYNNNQNNFNQQFNRNYNNYSNNFNINEGSIKDNFSNLVFSMGSFFCNVGNTISSKVKDYNEEVRNSEIFKRIKKKKENGIQKIKRKAKKNIDRNNNNQIRQYDEVEISGLNQEYYQNNNDNNPNSFNDNPVKFENQNYNEYELKDMNKQKPIINNKNSNNDNNFTNINDNYNNNVNINSFTENLSKNLTDINEVEPYKKIDETSLDN